MNRSTVDRRVLFLAFLILSLISLTFFWKVIVLGNLPMPLDALVGLYHPYRDYFAPQFPQGVVYRNFIATDPVLQQYPWKWLAIEYWKRREIPLLNPFNFSGTPLFANIQAGALYPLNGILFLWDFPAMWSVFIMLQPVLASTFMFLWLRSHRLHLLACIFGGIVWAFSSFNLVWMEWGNIGHAGLWLPLALLAIDKLRVTCLVSRQTSYPAKRDLRHSRDKLQKCWPWCLLLLASLASSLFAGHIQIFLYLFVAVIFYWFINLGVSRNSISYLLVTCILLLVTTSIQWYPTLQFSLQSNRAVEQQDALTREGFFIEPKQLVQAVAPDYFGNPATLNYRGTWNYAEQIIYVGIFPLLLGLSVLARNVSRDQKHFELKAVRRYLFALVALGLIFGVKNFISTIPYELNVPIWSGFQPTRLTYLMTFGLSGLSAIGFHLLISSERRTYSRYFFSAFFIGIVLFGLLVVSRTLTAADSIVSKRNLVFPGILLGISLGSIIFKMLYPGKKNRVTLWVVLAIAVTDLFRFGWKFTPFSPVKYLYPETASIQYLKRHMQQSDRYMTLDRRILPPNANILYHLKTIEGYDPLYSRAYASKISEMERGSSVEVPFSFGRIIRPTNFHSPLALELGVTYILSLSDISDQDWEKVFQEGETRVYHRISQSTDAL